MNHPRHALSIRRIQARKSTSPEYQVNLIGNTAKQQIHSSRESLDMGSSLFDPPIIGADQFTLKLKRKDPKDRKRLTHRPFDISKYFLPSLKQ